MPKARRLPQRTCLGCREIHGKRELWRIVRTAQGEVVFDPSGKLAGRGAYVCPKEECVREALRGKRLEKALRGDLPEGAAQRLLAELASRLSGGA
ncbi:MAG: YlxR family protein [Thermaerobacter sp.]|nr:YlxR family protein [Thermaerobacter sp.]